MENKESWTHLCLQMVHKKMKTDRFGSLFATPVLEASDSVIPRHVKDAYRVAITSPMDYRTVKEKLDSNAYASPQEFHDDMLLIYNNCIKFNPPVGVNKWIHDAAITCRSKYQKLWEKYRNDIERKYSQANASVRGSGSADDADDTSAVGCEGVGVQGAALDSSKGSGGASDSSQIQGQPFTSSGESRGVCNGQDAALSEPTSSGKVDTNASDASGAAEGSEGALNNSLTCQTSQTQLGASGNFQKPAGDPTTSPSSATQIIEPLPVFRLSMASIAEYKRRMGLLGDVSQAQKNDETSGIIEALPEQRMGLLSLQPTLEGAPSAVQNMPFTDPGAQETVQVQGLPFTSLKGSGTEPLKETDTAQVAETTPQVADTQMADATAESQQSPSSTSASASTSLSPLAQPTSGDAPVIDVTQVASQQPASQDVTHPSRPATTLETPQQLEQSQRPLQTFQAPSDTPKSATEPYQQLPPIMAREYNGLYQVNWLTENECNQYFPNACIIGLQTKPATPASEPPTSSNNIRYIYHQMFQSQKSMFDDKGKLLGDGKTLGAVGGLKQQQSRFGSEEKQREDPFGAFGIGEARLQSSSASGSATSGVGAPSESSAPSIDYTMQEHDRITFNLAESPSTVFVKPQFSWPSTSFADTEDELELELDVDVDVDVDLDREDTMEPRDGDEKGLKGNVTPGIGGEAAAELGRLVDRDNGCTTHFTSERVLELNVDMDSTVSLDEGTRRGLLENGFKRVIKPTVPVPLYADPNIHLYSSLRGYYKIDECCFTHEHQLVRHIRLALVNCGKCRVKISKRAQTLAKMLLTGGVPTLLLSDKCARQQVPFFNLKNASKVFCNNKLNLLWRSQHINDAIPRPLLVLHLLV